MVTIHWNQAALQRALRTSEMQRAVAHLGGAIADSVRSQDIKVGDRDGGAREIKQVVKVYVDDDGGSVVLAHPSGLAVQAKHGSLTRAASALGLEVH